MKWNPKVLRKLKLVNFLYYFYWKNSLNFPETISVETSSLCNLRCKMCPSVRAPKKWERGNMELSLFKKIVDEFKGHRKKFHLTLHKDGEPLINPDLFDMIRYLKVNGGTFNFHTNGTLLSPEKIRKLKDLPLTREDSITISINATNRADYLEITQKDLYDQLISNVESLLEIRNKITIKTLFVDNPEFSPRIKREFYEIWKNKVDEVVINKFRSWAGVFQQQQQNKRYPCLNLFNHPTINFNGDLMICCQAFSYLKGAIVGNILDSSIYELWTSNHYLNRLRIEHLQGLFHLNPICKKCSSWENYPDIWCKFHEIIGKPKFKFLRDWEGIE